MKTIKNCTVLILESQKLPPDLLPTPQASQVQHSRSLDLPRQSKKRPNSDRGRNPVYLFHHFTATVKIEFQVFRLATSAYCRATFRLYYEVLFCTDIFRSPPHDWIFETCKFDKTRTASSELVLGGTRKQLSWCSSFVPRNCLAMSLYICRSMIDKAVNCYNPSNIIIHRDIVRRKRLVYYLMVQSSNVYILILWQCFAFPSVYKKLYRIVCFVSLNK